MLLFAAYVCRVHRSVRTRSIVALHRQALCKERNSTQLQGERIMNRQYLVVLSAVAATLWSILCVIPPWAGTADAWDLNGLLHGDYAGTGAATCLFSPSGFNPNLTPKGSSFVNAFNVQAVLTFNGDGTGTINGRNVTNTFSQLPSGPPDASSDEFTAPFTYDVNPDRSFAVVFGPFAGTILTGPRAGQTFTIPTVLTSGLIAKGRKSATLATDTTAIEVITYSNGDSFPRICQRSRVLLKIGEVDD
jgi:hypothetical protein